MRAPLRWRVAAISAAVGLISGAAPIVVQAATVISVPGTFATIQSAIDAASDGDTIQVAPGTYPERINFVGKSITVESTDGPDVTIIDGEELGTVVQMYASPGSKPVLRGFTIQHGYGSAGGVATSGDQALIEGNWIVDNYGCSGGGIEATFSAATIRDNVIARNRQACSGGPGGGGVALRGAGTAQVLYNTISDNVNWASGGGISLFAAGAPVINGNVILRNNGGSWGGGISLGNWSDAAITNNVIAGNSAYKGGGIGWLVPSGAVGPTVVNNTIVANSASIGSAISSEGFDSNAVIGNNILVGDGPGAVLACSTWYGGMPPMLLFNDVFSSAGAPYEGICGQIQGGISVDPGFVDAATDDYHLSYGSPLIDAGTDVVGPEVDIDHEVRPWDGNGDGAAVRDIGADEAIFEPPWGTHDVYSGLMRRDACLAAGWTVDPDDPIRDLRVRVLVDGSVVAETVAGLFRQDLLDAGVSPDGYSAFDVYLGDLIALDVPHVIQVQAWDVETATWVSFDVARGLNCYTPVDEQLAALRDLAPKQSQRDKLTTVLRHYASGRIAQAIENLAAFIASVEAQAGKSILQSDADEYRARALSIRKVMVAEGGLTPLFVTGWWPGDGTPVDLIAGQHGVFHGDVTYGPGIDGQAFRFDGDGDFVEIPDADVHDARWWHGLTISLWVKFDTITGEQILVEKYVETYDSATAEGWTLTKLEDQSLGLGFGRNAGGVDSEPIAWKTGQWYHVVARRSGSSVALFLDGRLIAEGVAAEGSIADLSTGASLKIGHRGGPADTPGSLDDRGFWLTGSVDEFQLWVGYALTDDEITRLSNAGDLPG